ncbi:hypothetical protein Cs7R123_78340 [Catellatospora sp. TT07R-123]|uniref:hypothetical protein n=1 Tax=Catellatospora sp. TT07R-123 TaxID=2733863 RepID=UPI001B2CE9E9|nr:hypothetical protein [Catellatospora sp. TT07R-123]GHJ50492.1 hypothetical protein Cs7R123_78340 [Catellatospora sp. TT07R-123]
MRRQLAAAGTVALVSLSGLALVSTPSLATTGCDRPGGYAAGAAADLLKVSALDLRPLGLPLPAVADVTVGSASASMSATNAIRSTGTARYADARLLGLRLPTGPLDGRVYQQAPPSHQDPVRNNASSVDFGVVKAGTGDLLASAKWDDGQACGTAHGPAGDASAALVDASVLPGGRGALVRAAHNASSTAMTGTLIHRGRAASAAGAEIGLTDLDLIGGTVKVEVLTPPRLKVLATGEAATSAVDYQAPLLKITAPGVGTRTLDSAHRSFEVAVPFPATGGLLGVLNLPALRRRAQLEGLPLLDSGTLGSLLSGLPVGNLTPIANRLTGSAGTDTLLPQLPELGGLPQLGDLLGATRLGGLGTPCQLAVLKISIGELEQRTTDRGVTAQAASLRIQVLALGDDRGESAAVLDLGVGMLRAAAAAPRRTGGGSPQPSATAGNPGGGSSGSPSAHPSGGNGGGSGPGQSPAADSSDCDTPGCNLPRTGTNIALIAGAGVVLFIAGRFLLLLARRRATEGPTDLLS